MSFDQHHLQPQLLLPLLAPRPGLPGSIAYPGDVGWRLLQWGESTSRAGRGPAESPLKRLVSPSAHTHLHTHAEPQHRPTDRPTCRQTHGQTKRPPGHRPSEPRAG